MNNVSLNVSLMNDASNQTTIIHMGKKCKQMPIVDVITKNCPILILTTFLNHHDVARLCKVNHTWRRANKGCNGSLVISALVAHGFKLKYYNRLIDHNKKFNINIFPCERACIFDMETFSYCDESTEYFSDGIITNLPNLQVLLNIPLKKKEDMVLFEKMPKLKAISFAGNMKLDNLSVLTKLKNLECLFFNQNYIRDDGLVSLSSIVSLRKLNIYNSFKFSDAGVTSLTRLTNLEELRMNCAGITNINFLNSLTKLKILVLCENGRGRLADLSPIYTVERQ